jgi:3,4-dihydroxy 2-butanone 4-phosphate synthase/GTP cyclohydrolase II
MHVYVNRIAYAEHIALVKGDIHGPEPVLVRMHALNLLDDVLGDLGSGRGGELQSAMRIIGDTGRGVVVLIREPLPTSLSDRVKGRSGAPPVKAGDLRDYGVGAQVLLDLGIKDMILLSDTKRKIVGLEGYGLRVVAQRSVAPAGDEE